MKFIFLVNPISGGSGTHIPEIIEGAVAKLSLKEDEYAIEETQREGAVDQAAKAFDRAGTIISVGGDGTMRAVIAGYLKQENPDRSVAVYPAGTGNDLFRHMYSYPEFKKDRAAYLARMLQGTEREHRLWSIGGWYFGNYVSLGYDATVSHKFALARARKPNTGRLHNYWTYMRLGLFNLGRRMSKGIELQLDDRTVTARKAMVIAGISRYAGGSHIPHNGQQELVCLPINSIFSYTRFMATRLFGRPSPGLKAIPLKEGVLKHKGEGVLQIDGETMALSEMPHELAIKFETTIKVLVPQGD
ncbi:diacylglycerol/lipid kinase family protein [Planctomycetota bacterium]